MADFLDAMSLVIGFVALLVPLGYLADRIEREARAMR